MDNTRLDQGRVFFLPEIGRLAGMHGSLPRGGFRCLALPCC